MRKKYIGILIAAFIIICIAGVYMLHSQDRSKQMQESMADFIKQDDAEAAADDITDFSWDYLYIAAPYSTKEDIEKQMGISGHLIETSDQDAEYQMFFVKENKIIAAVRGDNDKMKCNFSDYNSKLEHQNLYFHVTRDNGSAFVEIVHKDN